MSMDERAGELRPSLERTGRPAPTNDRLSHETDRFTGSGHGHDLRFDVGVHEATLRVNVRWVTPLGEETASTS
jgi:hypothetical protein